MNDDDNFDDNFVVFSWDKPEPPFSIRVEKRSGSVLNWEDEDEWQDLGLSTTTSGGYRRYHLTAEQWEKFRTKQEKPQ
jgi:hypothetical protein